MRDEVEVTNFGWVFIKTGLLSCIPLNHQFAFARIVAQVGRYEKNM
jgi:hypothetical protein